LEPPSFLGEGGAVVALMLPDYKASANLLSDGGAFVSLILLRKIIDFFQYKNKKAPRQKTGHLLFF